MKSLCGRKSCSHLCSRSVYCPAGQERASLLLGQQSQRRETRRREARKFQQDIEKAIPVFAGSFKAFQNQILWERRQLPSLPLAVSATTELVIEGEPGFTYGEYLENYKESEVI